MQKTNNNKALLQPAFPADIPLISALAHRIWWAHYPGIITPEQIEYMLGRMYSDDALERQMTVEGIQFWLVLAGEAACGFAAINTAGEGRYFLHKFYLDTAQQHKGLGTSAFLALVAGYPDLRELRLMVNRLNFKSINFYFKMGFRIERCMETPIGQGYVMDDFQMLWQKPIE